MDGMIDVVCLFLKKLRPGFARETPFACSINGLLGREATTFAK
jgi:hypothetical protein